MKIFKKLFLLVPMVLSLASCSGDESPAGTYSFQLGSDTGTHAGIHLKLTDEDAETQTSEEQGKKFELKFDLGTSAMTGVFGLLTHLDTVIEYIENHTGSDISSVEDLIQKVEDAIEEKGDADVPVTVPGYYYFKESTNPTTKKAETRIMMGIDFNFIPDMPIEIPASLVEMLMYATYDGGDNINVIIPVSIEDLLYQIYWYGYRIAGIKSITNPVDLHEENEFIQHHDIGSHPTSDDVTTIQNYQKDREAAYKAGKLSEDSYETGEFIYNTYHDYHTLTMGLAKTAEKKNNGK